MSVSLVARKECVADSLLFQWRKLERQGALTAVTAGEAVVPASELAAASTEIANFKRELGRRTLEKENLKEAAELCSCKKLDCALTLIARGWSVKTVCRSMGLVRSHVKRQLDR